MFLRSHRNPKWAMQSHELNALLGFKPSSPIPPDYHGIHYIKDGAGDIDRVVVIARPVANRRKARVFFTCYCGKDIPFGRIQQHQSFRCIQEGARIKLINSLKGE